MLGFTTVVHYSLKYHYWALYNIVSALIAIFTVDIKGIYTIDVSYYYIFFTEIHTNAFELHTQRGHRNSAGVSNSCQFDLIYVT